MHIITDIDPSSNAWVASTPFGNDFFDRTAFFNTDATARTVTGARSEFIGRNGSLQDPDAMRRTRLSGKLGPALDPCAAIQVSIELVAGQTREIVFMLGALGANQDRALITTYTSAEQAKQQTDTDRT